MNDIILVIPEDKIGFEPLVYPPLGLLYISSILLKEGYKIQIYDLREEKIENIPESKYYCFTSVTPQIEDVKKYSLYIKNKYKNCFTVIGGSHATFMSDEILNYFDSIIIGEGELSIVEVIKNKIYGIFDKYKFGYENIDSIPFPSRDLISFDKVFNNKLWQGYGYGKGPIATTFITSRGCPWKCAFCANIPHKVRYRSVENIIEEMDLLINKYNCYNFRFIDDNFLMNKKRFRKLCLSLKDININFRCSARSDCIDEEICSLLIEAGCKEIGFGVETCDNKLLKILNKNETVEDHIRAINIAKKNGLQTKVFFMSGLPFETKETIELNKEFVRNVKPDKWIATLFTPFPGCDIWNNSEKYGIKIKNRNFEEFYQSYPSNSVMEREDCSSEELTEHFEDFIKFMEEYKNRN